MKTFEISKRKNKNGRRHFSAVLHEIYPDECVDTVNECGTIYNKNGITWLEKYCADAAPSIQDMSLRVEFLDEERTEISGHGETGTDDGLPVFENANVIGHFTKGHIDTIKDENGADHRVMIGEGYIDEMCYKNFVDKLKSEIEDGDAPSGSVEIYQTESNDGIVYEYGYKETGRIPKEFVYSGYAILGVPPADEQAKIIEMNQENKEETSPMTEAEIKALVEQTVSEFANVTAEMNECRQDCENKISEANSEVEKVTAEKNEIQASADAIKAALESLQKEYEELSGKYDQLWEERKMLEKALAEAQAKERIGELNQALSEYTEEQREYAKDEIEAFKADPVNSEINTVTDKILREIGVQAMKAAAEEAKHIAETNAANTETVLDIFGEMAPVDDATEDVNIF